MGDMGDAFREMDADTKAAKARRRIYGTDALRAQGIRFDTRNDGNHLIVTHNGKTVDYWPSSGRWIVRNSTTQGYGVKKLIEQVTA